MTYQESWDAIMERSPRSGEAEKSFALFFNDHLPHLRKLRLPALDIGPGHGARHSQYMQQCGLPTIAVDVSHTVMANFHGDVREIHIAPEVLSLVVDIKTMCYLDDPPIDKVHSWLCPNGFFYCMTPTDRHKKEEGGWDVSQGLPIQLYSKEEVCDLLHMFADVNVRELYEPIGRTQWTSTWCIEARK